MPMLEALFASLPPSPQAFKPTFLLLDAQVITYRSLNASHDIGMLPLPRRQRFRHKPSEACQTLLGFLCDTHVF